MLFAGKIEPLHTQHNKKDFRCGEPALDDYLQRFARQHAVAKVSRTYVAAIDSRIHGFYSLAMSSIAKDNLPATYQKGLPNFPIPVARLARLGVALNCQKQGLGQLLLLDALYRCYRLSEDIGMAGVVVDAKHERAQTFYQQYEFESFLASPLTLWLPSHALDKMFSR